MDVNQIFVKFVGTDSVVEHIAPFNNNKNSNTISKKKPKTKAPDSQIDEESKEEFCEATDVKHSNDFVAHENEVAGSEIYSFKTPRKSLLIKKVTNDLLTPRRQSKVGFSLEPQTPRQSCDVPMTPRSILKKTPSLRTGTASKSVDGPRKTPRRLWKRNNVEEDDLSDSDSEASSLSDEEEEEEDDNQKSKVARTPSSVVETPSSMKTPKSARKLDMNGAAMPRSRKKKQVDENVNEKVLAENYFETHHSSKSVTSDRTLSRLDVPHLEPSEIVENLSKVNFLYEDDRWRLCEQHRKMFPQWMFNLHQGFNLLLHGLGSKMELLEQFRQNCISEFSHVVINGFFPGLTFKSVISAISEVLTGNPSVPANSADHINHLKNVFQEQDFPDFFLIVHNIDGAALRNEKTQQSLSLLCQIEGFHLVASVDHINSPLLWDLTKLSRLNWLWFETTTYEGYVEETSYENSLMIKQSGSLALSSLSHVMKSLTPNARGIFLLVIKYQLDNKDEAGFQGFAFPDLYQRCREAFLVNSEQTLRVQLVEFKDHKLIKTKTGADGTENILITLDDTILMTFMEQNENEN